MSINWDKNIAGSPFTKWTQIGQVVEGTLTKVSEASYQGNEFHDLEVTGADGVSTIISASQTRLKLALRETDPDVGDGIRIEYLGESETSRPGQHPAKLFKVNVARKGAASALAAEELV